MSVRKRNYSTGVTFTLALLLSGCGGDGGGSGQTPPPIVVNPAPAPAPAPIPTPAPAPAPTPTPSGTVATYTQGLPPEADGIILEFKATNAGLYMLVLYSDDSKPSKVLKLQGRPDDAQSWLSATPDTEGGPLVISYAPTNIYSESTRAVSFYWTSHSADRGKFDKWGFYTANAGGVSISAAEDGVGTLLNHTEQVYAGGISGIVTPRPWLITARRNGSDGYGVYQDDGGYTAANTISDRFGKAATPDLLDIPTAAVSHPTDPQLYIGVGNTLYVYDADRRVTAYQFPNAGITARFSDLIWSDGDLYIGYGGKAYRLRDKQVSFFADLPFAFGDLPGRFCITGGSMYMLDGTARSLAGSTTREWIARGALSAAQSADAAAIKGGLGGGIFCSTKTTGTIYSTYPTISGKRGIRVITPLP